MSLAWENGFSSPTENIPLGAPRCWCSKSQLWSPSHAGPCVCFFNQWISGCLFLSLRSAVPELKWDLRESSAPDLWNCSSLMPLPLLTDQFPTFRFPPSNSLPPSFFLIHPVSQSVSNYWSQRQMFGESFSCTKFFRQFAFPPPVRLKDLLRLIFPFQNVFNCRALTPTGQTNDVGHNMCEHLFRGYLPSATFLPIKSLFI